MKKAFIIAGLWCGFTATPALAQNSSAIEPYAGGFVGYDHAKYHGGGISGSNDGVTYGGLIGIQTNITENTIVGIEGEISDSDLSEKRSNVFAANDTMHVRLGRDFFIGARAGYRITPNIMIYGKGGYTNARASFDYSTSLGTLHAHDDLDGLRVGGGVELALGRIRLRTEYRYSEYQKFKYQNVSTGVDANRHQVLAIAAWAF